MATHVKEYHSVKRLARFLDWLFPSRRNPNATCEACSAIKPKELMIRVSDGWVCDERCKFERSLHLWP